MSNGLDRAEGFAVLLILLSLGVCIAGWINNVIWTFKQVDLAGVALGIFGALVPPIGAIHGVWLWFV